ncbi:MAG TPA: hypothetical protein VJA47_01080 [archaeon]|nr:hypothetical protein [archaeon]
MLKDLKRYSLGLFSSDFRNGYVDGSFNTMCHPIRTTKALRNLQSYETIVGEFVDLRRWQTEKCVDPDYKMGDEDVFRRGYKTGVYVALGFSAVTIGVANALFWLANQSGINDARRNFPTIVLTEDPEPKETATMDFSRPSTLKTIKFR